MAEGPGADLPRLDSATGSAASQYPEAPGMHNTPSRDDYTYTRTRYNRQDSFWDRVKRNLVAVVVGGLLICIAIGLLFYNEGRAVQSAKSISEGLEQVVRLRDIEVPFREHNHDLIHISGPLKTSEILHDDTYGVAMNAVKLHRKVEMYQWVETESTREVPDGDEVRKETSYSYDEEWRSDLVSDNNFYHQGPYRNPKEMPVDAKILEAKHVQVGGFYLSKNLVGSISNFKQFKPTSVPAGVDARIHDDMFYHGSDPSRPQVGDVRVKFMYAGLSGKPGSSVGDPDVVSVIGRQDENMVNTYSTEAGDDIELLYMGRLSAEKIFAQQRMQNTLMTWAMRFGGWLLMFIGFGCTTRIFIALVEWVPIIREMMMMGIVTLNLTLSLSLSLTIIAFGWIAYRPWLGLSILFCAVLPFLINSFRQRRHPRPWQRTDHSYVD